MTAHWMRALPWMLLGCLLGASCRTSTPLGLATGQGRAPAYRASFRPLAAQTLAEDVRWVLTETETETGTGTGTVWVPASRSAEFLLESTFHPTAEGTWRVRQTVRSGPSGAPVPPLEFELSPDGAWIRAVGEVAPEIADALGREWDGRFALWLGGNLQPGQVTYSVETLPWSGGPLSFLVERTLERVAQPQAGALLEVSVRCLAGKDPALAREAVVRALSRAGEILLADGVTCSGHQVFGVAPFRPVSDLLELEVTASGARPGGRLLRTSLARVREEEDHGIPTESARDAGGAALVAP